MIAHAKETTRSSADIGGSIYASKDGMYGLGNVIFAHREPLHEVEHDRLDIFKLRKMMDSFLLKENNDGFYVDLHVSHV